MSNFYYNQYGKQKEKYMQEELLKLGVSSKKIKEYKSKGLCLCCGYLRKDCQCAFGGSAHPNFEELVKFRKIELDKLRGEKDE